MHLARRALRYGAVGAGLHFSAHRLEEWAALSEPQNNAEAGRAFWYLSHAESEALPCAAQLTTQNDEHAVRLATAALGVAASHKRSRVETFSILEGRSSLCDAGNGAFISGRARKGQLLTFYKGPVYSPLTGRLVLFLEHLSGFESKGYIYCRDDGYLVKGVTTGRNSVDQGPMLNHPPIGVQPNAMFFSITLDARHLEDATAEVLHSISWYAVRPKSFSTESAVRVVGLIALRDVEHEELFVDYGFSTDTPHPDWYAPVKALGAE
jgi:hypothetical protein